MSGLSSQTLSILKESRELDKSLGVGGQDRQTRTDQCRRIPADGVAAVVKIHIAATQSRLLEMCAIIDQIIARAGCKPWLEDLCIIERAPRCTLTWIKDSGSA